MTAAPPPAAPPPAAPPPAAPPPAAPPPAERPVRLRELAWLFGRLGFTAFGGPAAHVAMMEDEVVRRRGWMTRERLLDLIGAANLIPGPTSTELAIHIGHDRAGWAGLVVAGSCFILPAVAMVVAIAWAYVRFGALPAVGGILYGVKPVIIAVVAQALWSLGRTAIKSVALGAVAVVALAASLAGVDELIVLAAAGLVAVIGRSVAARRVHPGWLVPVPPMGGVGAMGAMGAIGATGATGAAAAGVGFGLWPLFWVFLKIGAVLFGSGYVLLAFLRTDLVERLHWLTEGQLLDAVAVGQVTPGPVFTTATFIGYVLGGGGGAAVATLGIFLPSFAFVALSGPILPRIRRSLAAGAFLDGVNAASLAIMAAVAIALGRAAIIDVPTVVLAAASAALLIRYRLNSAYLVLGGAVVGAVIAFRPW